MFLMATYMCVLNTQAVAWKVAIYTGVVYGVSIHVLWNFS
jgi:hypothetical protein